MENTQLISGTAAAVIIGAALMIVPWFVSEWQSFFGKLFLSIIGIVFVYFGLYFSRG